MARVHLQLTLRIEQGNFKVLPDGNYKYICSQELLNTQKSDVSGIEGDYNWCGGCSHCAETQLTIITISLLRGLCIPRVRLNKPERRWPRPLRLHKKVSGAESVSGQVQGWTKLVENLGS